MSDPKAAHVVSPAQTRLTSIVSHLRASTNKHKIVVTRHLGPDVMPLILNRPEFEVCFRSLAYRSQSNLRHQFVTGHYLAWGPRLWQGLVLKDHSWGQRDPRNAIWEGMTIASFVTSFIFDPSLRSTQTHLTRVCAIRLPPIAVHLTTQQSWP